MHTQPYFEGEPGTWQHGMSRGPLPEMKAAALLMAAALHEKKQVVLRINGAAYGVEATPLSQVDKQDTHLHPAQTTSPSFACRHQCFHISNKLDPCPKPRAKSNSIHNEEMLRLNVPFPLGSSQAKETAL